MALSWIEAFRDWVLIIWGLTTIVLFAMIIAFIFYLWRGTRGLIGNVRLVVNEDVRPLIATSKESVNNVTGTTRFVGDTVVSPIIRLYGLISGLRRGIGIFLGLTGRRRGGK